MSWVDTVTRCSYRNICCRSEARQNYVLVERTDCVAQYGKVDYFSRFCQHAITLPRLGPRELHTSRRRLAATRKVRWAWELLYCTAMRSLNRSQ
jgi:hypothetical protein